MLPTPVAKAFLDTNVLLYLLSADETKANRAEDLVQTGATISVQVLNEITNVTRRKLNLPWHEVHEFVSLIQSLCVVESITSETHNLCRPLAERYTLNIYDAMIVASARLAECEILYTEDMQHDMFIEQRLRVCNPFKE